MREAKSLSDLLKIREANHSVIEKIKGTIGSALGRKNEKGKPAILIFVPRKINEKWLPNDQIVPKRLETPEGLYCPTDVIDSSHTAFDRDRGSRLMTVDLYGNPGIIGSRELFGYRQLNHESKYNLLNKLRGDTERITPGSKLAFYDENWAEYSATLACFAKDDTGHLGFITNQHVGISVGNTLYFPETTGIELGNVKSNIDRITDQERFPSILSHSKSTFTVDAGFVALGSYINIQNDIDLRLPILDKNNNIQMQTLGPPLELHLDTMGPIGKEVIGVGQMRSFQKGKIFAFAYQSSGQFAESFDYLIIGEKNEDFSDPGDSGKLIVTADGNYQPLAILWGGWFERLRHGHRQENWTCATDINLILNMLRLTIVRN